MRKSKHRDELLKEIQRVGQTEGLNQAFTTFLEVSATSIAATMDPFNPEEREKRYREITAGMKPELLTAYARMLSLLYLAISEHQDDPCDILGDIYHELRLNNEWNGQFFTPDNVCRLMAQMTLPTSDLEGKEAPITVNEPTCGSGAMVIGAIWAMKMGHFDYSDKVIFVAQDLDIRCVWMTYLQLTLYRVPAVVIHSNTLTMEEYSRWHTPYLTVPMARVYNAAATNTPDKAARESA